MLIHLALVLFAYLLGSLSTAIIVCKVMGLPDPRSQGSGNPGATNVLRIGGKKAAALVLLGDVLKGVLPVLLARAFTDDAPVLSAVALAAVLGHLFPLFFGFRGGKGVATGLGVLLGLAWNVALAVLATWLLMAAAFRISSLSALTAALVAPLAMWWLRPEREFFWLALLLSALLLWRHRSNMKNLFAGKEGRIGQRPQ
jgi:glycerol-3-phosphate acyltransferase PlsY